MLYFCFNVDNLVVPKIQRSIATYNNGVVNTVNDIEDLSIGDIEMFFFEKIHNDFGDISIGVGIAYYDVLNIPVDAFSVDDNDDAAYGQMIYYILNQYCNVKIEKLDNNSLCDFGIKIEFCKKIRKNEVNALLEADFVQNGYSYVTEDVLWKNMTTDEKAQAFSNQLQKIECAYKELIIIDPYLFYTEENEYCELLSKVLMLSKAKVIMVITEKKHFKENSYNYVKSIIGCDITIKYSSDYHDRFWIGNRKKGFYTGTSFNGVGKRISLINQMSESDIMEIVNQMKTDLLLVD